jgi:hypothetical protein
LGDKPNGTIAFSAAGSGLKERKEIGEWEYCFLLYGKEVHIISSSFMGSISDLYPDTQAHHLPALRAYLALIGIQSIFYALYRLIFRYNARTYQGREIELRGTTCQEKALIWSSVPTREDEILNLRPLDNGAVTRPFGRKSLTLASISTRKLSFRNPLAGMIGHKLGK